MLAMAQRLGLPEAAIEPRGRHSALTGLAHGRRIQIVVPKTPGDKRGWRNTLAEIRRVMRQDIKGTPYARYLAE
jgi:hypothetical protein